MQLRYYLRLTCKLIYLFLFLSLGFNAYASDDGFSVGVNTGVYSDSSNKESDDQFAYSRLLFGYHMNNFGGRISLTKSNENELSPYFSLDGTYDFKVSKNYILRPTIGMNFIDHNLEPDVGLEVQYLISKNTRFVLSNNYRLTHDPEYFFGLGFEYRFLSKDYSVKDEPRQDLSSPIETAPIDVSPSLEKVCKNSKAMTFIIKDSNEENVWEKINILIKNKYQANIPVDKNGLASFQSRIPNYMGGLSFQLIGHVKDKKLTSDIKRVLSLPPSDCNEYSIDIYNSKIIEISSSDQ